MTFKWIDRVDEANNPIERWLLVHTDDLARLHLGCCIATNDRDRLIDLGGELAVSVLASEDSVYIPEQHWLDHGVVDQTDDDLVVILNSPPFAAGSVPQGVEVVDFTTEADDGMRLIGAAHVELRRRGHSEVDIEAYKTGDRWPEGH